MKIIIAPNAFKGSLSADKAAQALKEGLQQGGWKGSLVTCPVGDGGDGTGALLRQYLGASVSAIPVCDPLGRWIEAPLGWVASTQTAIIEMADASGLRLLQPTEYNPLTTNTRGLGQLIKAAFNKRAKTILLCIGGSATVDGGAGMLQTLGLQFLDKKGDELHDLPARFSNLETLDDSGLDRRLAQTSITILCDVKNKLLGENGAAAIFGPQKGADPAGVKMLDSGLQQLDQVVTQYTGFKMSEWESGGAAGGIAAALAAFGKAQIVPGTDYLLQLIGFKSQLADADWVITGEGCIDQQTLQGKAPFGVAKMAKETGAKVIGVAGSIPTSNREALNRYFDWLLPINQPGHSLAESMRDTFLNLVTAGKKIAGELGPV